MKAIYEVHRYSRFMRSFGTGRNYCGRKIQFFNFIQIHFIVADNAAFFSALQHIVAEVVGEGVVVVE